MSETFSAIAMTPESAHKAVLQGYAHAKALLANGENVKVSVGPALEPISIKQRKFFHGPVLQQISEQVRVNGERFTTDCWKAYFKKLFLKPTWHMQKLPGQKRKTPHREEPSTERLGVSAYAKFTNQVIDHAVAEFGVEFVFTAEERELIVRKPRAKAKPKETETA